MRNYMYSSAFIINALKEKGFFKENYDYSKAMCSSMREKVTIIDSKGYEYQHELGLALKYGSTSPRELRESRV